MEDINDKIANLETNMTEVKTSLAETKVEVTGMKEDIKDMKEHQVSTDSDLKELTITIKTFITKQDSTNDFMKENLSSLDRLIEKMDARQVEYEKKNDNRYIEIIKENSQQDINSLKQNNCVKEEAEDKIDKKLKPAKDTLIYLAQRFAWVLLGGILLLLISNGVKIGI